MVYKIYGEGLSTEDVDLMTAAIPYPIMEDTYRWITRKGAEYDRELLESLNQVRFRTYFGSDDTGFQMMFMRGEGGYYIDVGCSRLIASGRIGVIPAEDVTDWTGDGPILRDGSQKQFDAVILATGYCTCRKQCEKFWVTRSPTGWVLCGVSTSISKCATCGVGLHSQGFG